MRRLITVLLPLVLVISPLPAGAADLVVWWMKGFYGKEDEALSELVNAFEQSTVTDVALVQPEAANMVDRVEKALSAGQPPDFLFSNFTSRNIARWAYQGHLMDLGLELGPLLDLFDADTIEAVTLLNGETGERGLYAVPMGRGSNHIHVWRSLLEEAGFTLKDIPDDWDGFWAFWCDEVQPAVRRATGRDDVWGVGLPMSAAGLDTHEQLNQFQLAYDAGWIGSDGRLEVDRPDVRRGMARALEDYVRIWRRGCTPPDSVEWTSFGNNRAFLDQRVVMTANSSLSIPAALRTTRPVDYFENTATIPWPSATDGEALVLDGFISRGVVFAGGESTAAAAEFVRFLIEDGWLAHWLSFAGDRILPPMRSLIDQPFWLDASDPHRLRGAVQLLSQPHRNSTDGVRDLEWRSAPIWDENVWGEAVHRVVADGLTAEEAVDEAIARIKKILTE